MNGAAHGWAAMPQAFLTLWLEMAPYLLLGFAAILLLRRWVSTAWVEQQLGKPGWRTGLKASLLGVPLPLCSCGVLPVAAGLKRSGASPGSVAAFTAATPQTGLDSIAATWALLGPTFTAVRVGVAFISGLVAGALVELKLVRRAPRAAASSCGCSDAGPPLHSGVTNAEDGVSSCCGGGTATALEVPTAKATCCSTQPAEATEGCCGAAEATRTRDTWRQALHFSLVRMPQDLALPLLAGLSIAAVMTAWLPSDALAGAWASGALAYLWVTLAAVPLYVCSAGSIPLAYALVQAGLSPGAALVFLIAGPATNAATVTTLGGLLGWGSTLRYLIGLLLTAWLAGALLDAGGLSFPGLHGHLHHGEGGVTLWRWACGAGLALLLLHALLRHPRLRAAR